MYTSSSPNVRRVITSADLRAVQRVSATAASKTVVAGDRVVELSMRATSSGSELTASELSWARPRRSEWIAEAVRPFVAIIALAVAGTPM